MRNTENKILSIRIVFQSILERLIKDGYSCTAITNSGSIYISTGRLPTFIDSNIMRSYLVCLTEQEKENLVNLATAVYLDEWLENDMNAKQTVYGFAMRGYCDVDQRSLNCEDSLKKSLHKRLESVMTKYRDMMSLQEEQSQREKVPRKPDAAPLKKKNKKLENIISNTPNSGIWYDFPSLCFIYWISEDKFPFYNLLIYNKELLKTTSSQLRNDDLKESYRKYFDAIFKLRKEKDDKIYTISAIMLHKIEPSFMHMISAFLALDVAKTEKINMEDAMEYTIPQWSRWQYKSLYIERPIHSVNMDALCYQVLKKLTDQDETSHRIMTVNKCILQRGLLAEMLCRITGFPQYHPCNMPSWTPIDYSYAAEFFKKDYPIIEKHISFELQRPEDWPDSVYDNIRYFYERFEDQELGYLRKEAQNRRKSRNNKKQNEQLT